MVHAGSGDIKHEIQKLLIEMDESKYDNLINVLVSYVGILITQGYHRRSLSACCVYKYYFTIYRISLTINSVTSYGK